MRDPILLRPYLGCEFAAAYAAAEALIPAAELARVRLDKMADCGALRR